MKKPSGRSPRRRHPTREPRRVLRVLTEGKTTEPGYLSRWARRNDRNDRIHLDLSDTGMTPDALVRRAREHVRRNRQSKRADPDFDEIWCVFDTDEHPNLPGAIDDARRSGIEVAVSNPCFELWLVLHVEDQTAHVHRHEVQRRANELGLSDGKKITDAAWSRLIEAFETAKQRARALDERHEGNDSPPRSNPSTDVWRLADRIRHAP